MDEDGYDVVADIETIKRRIQSIENKIRVWEKNMVMKRETEKFERMLQTRR